MTDNFLQLNKTVQCRHYSPVGCIYSETVQDQPKNTHASVACMLG